MRARDASWRRSVIQNGNHRDGGLVVLIEHVRLHRPAFLSSPLAFRAPL